VPYAKLAKSKFQDNMEFLQWLYSYAVKTSPHIARTYNGYERRLEAYSKQNSNFLYKNIKKIMKLKKI